MDIRKIKKLIELLESSNLNEIEVQEGEESVRISRSGAPNALPTTVIQPSANEAKAGKSADPTPVKPNLPADQEDLPSEVEGHIISAPMVGTIYMASSPDAEPFVKVGDSVKAGDVVCIIEAMKIMNQIESDDDGIVAEILCQDGEAVEFGQALMRIK